MKSSTDALRANACRTIDDGDYALRCSAGSVRDAGLLTVAGSTLSADNPAFRLRSRIDCDGPWLQASVKVWGRRDGERDGSGSVDFRGAPDGHLERTRLPVDRGRTPRMIVEIDCTRHREDLP